MPANRVVAEPHRFSLHETGACDACSQFSCSACEPLFRNVEPRNVFDRAILARCDVFSRLTGKIRKAAGAGTRPQLCPPECPPRMNVHQVVFGKFLYYYGLPSHRQCCCESRFPSRKLIVISKSLIFWRYRSPEISCSSVRHCGTHNWDTEVGHS